MNKDLAALRDPQTVERLKRVGDALVSASGNRFPIVKNIPRFVDPENYASDFGRQWQMFPATQLDSHTGMPWSEDRLARCFRGELDQVAGRRVLEAGSGAGRFTEVLLKYGAKLDSFDFSTAVEANAINNGVRDFTLAQADIRAMPFAKESYDYVVCLGVLQHTPDTEESIAKLWAMVKPGGKLIIDHYRWNLWLWLPPPLGSAEKLYRRIILSLPPEKRWPAVKRFVDFWFPIYWRFRESEWAERILGRIAGIHFYYRTLPLGPSRQRHYELSLLDTHDGMTDRFKRYRTIGAIRRTLEKLGAEDLHVWGGGNGVEAWAQKRAQPRSPGRHQEGVRRR